MNKSIGKLTAASWAALVLASFLMTPAAEAQRRAGGGGGGGGGGAAGARAGGGAQASHNRVDARSTDVRNTSVNNVNVQRNVNVDVDCSPRCGGWDHPVAATAVVAGTVAVTAAAVGSMVAAVPAGCVPVSYGGMVYQQCGATWYMPQGPQYVVVHPPY
ncbi:hypothetical protein GCM10027034_13530 [Ramlibacter solisilvae]|uniref:Uncharacterized protein n=1 Tax=Ramlibacter tataouinensis TaxID=94132 RepID=A0A127JWZ2_9BURK|nr:hypothetical protein [Ramlibacter tataouinensis]AMO24393.1 hypothetical protein UC35_18060 [Ramlibacter tataouinensis]